MSIASTILLGIYVAAVIFCVLNEPDDCNNVDPHNDNTNNNINNIDNIDKESE